MDDDPAGIVFARRCIDQAFAVVDILECNEGKEALKRLRRVRVDVVVTNNEMGASRSRDVIPAIRAEHPTLPVVMLTSIPWLEEQALKAGVSEFLLVDQVNQLPQVIRRLTGVRQAPDQLS